MKESYEKLEAIELKEGTLDNGLGNEEKAKEGKSKTNVRRRKWGGNDTKEEVPARNTPPTFT